MDNPANVESEAYRGFSTPLIQTSKGKSMLENLRSALLLGRTLFRRAISHGNKSNDKALHCQGWMIFLETKAAVSPSILGLEYFIINGTTVWSSHVEQGAIWVRSATW